MGNVVSIVRRDALRLLRVPAAWVILFGILCIPPLYAWVNIIGFWDPYGNTSHIQVAVANEDEGASNSITGTLDLGAQIVGNLKGNHELAWIFVDKTEAMRQVESGESYAAIVIPHNLSERLSGLLTGDTQTPRLDYYVNEKANAIAPKITDTGTTQLDRQVNDTIVSTISEAISTSINTTSADISGQAATATKDAIDSLDTVKGNIANTRSTLADLNAALAAIPGQTQTAREAVQRAKELGGQAGEGLSQASTLLGQTQRGINAFSTSTSTVLDGSSALLSQASAQANIALGDASASLNQASGGIGSALSSAKQANDNTKDLIEALRNSGIDTAIIDRLDAQNTKLGESIATLQRLNTDAGNTATDTAAAGDAINTATQQTLQQFGTARSSLISGTLPQFTTGLTTLAGTSASLGAGLQGQQSLIAQSSAVLDQLDQTAASTAQALEQTDAGLAKLYATLDTVTTDLSALSSSTTVSSLFGGDGTLDAATIASFMQSPTSIATTTVYPVNSYGSGMAPLFTSLSLWVGAFMLMVMVKLEVDDEGLVDPTIGERYWGRWALLAILGTIQALITTIGDLLIGVQTVNAAMFVLTGILTSLVYVSITYALSTTFQHIGKGLCVALVIVQIPGASGLYPIEMMPGFFRAMHPFFPFTPAIAALRETIGGFYGNDWLSDIARLLVFAALSFALGLAARPHLVNLNRLFAREIAESGMIIGEPVLQTGREYRISQVLRALTSNDAYRRAIEQRAADFATLYPKLKRGALIAGIVVPAALAVTFSLTNGTKLVALAAWVIWILLIVGFLMTIELMRNSIDRQVRLGTLGEAAIRGLVYDYERPKMRHLRLGARQRGGQDSHAGSGPSPSPDQDAERTAELPPVGDAPSAGHAAQTDHTAPHARHDGGESRA